MVAYDDGGGRDFFFSVRGSAALAVDPVAAAEAARGAEWIHVSGSSIGFGDPLAATVEATVEEGLRRGARLSLDPNLRPDSPAEARERTARLARRASVVFPSAGELEALGLDDGRAGRAAGRSSAPRSATPASSCTAPAASRSPGARPRCARSTRPAPATRSRPRSSPRSRVGRSRSARPRRRARSPPTASPCSARWRRGSRTSDAAHRVTAVAAGTSSTEPNTPAAMPASTRSAARRRLLDRRPLDRAQALLLDGACGGAAHAAAGRDDARRAARRPRRCGRASRR